MMNFKLTLFLICVSTSISFGQGFTSTTPAQPFGLQPDQLGGASNTVNLLTGDVTLPINLVSLAGRNGIGASVTINYNSNVTTNVSTWNREAPTGVLGLGWDLSLPRIICNNKMTGTREDDEYFLVEGGTSNKLIRTKTSSDGGGSFYEYNTKNYQFWKVKYYYDIGEIAGSGSGPNKWEITKEDGTRYIYGDKNSGRKTIQYVVRWENWIGNSSQVSGQSQLANVWNLSEVVGVWGDKTLFEYETTEQFVGSGSGQKHTEASHIKQITDAVGKKIQFTYNIKQTQFFVEPHTEQGEPDAYQEFYETKYLDRIEVLDELNNKYLSFHFTYSTLNDATPFAKMLLATIEQRNASSNALPQMKFDYIVTGPAKGALQAVIYPTGGRVTYEYTQKTIGHSARDLTIQAPSGYSEPMTWTGDDYIIVAWRKMGSAWTHDSGPQNVRLFAYQWLGEWKEADLGTITNVPLPNEQTLYPIYMYYGDFQVTLQGDFFAVLSKNTGNSYFLKAFSKTEGSVGSWTTLSRTIDVGDGTPVLLSGTDFIVVAPFRDDATHPCQVYTFKGVGFTESTINQTLGDHYYTSSNNFFISQNRAGVDGQPDFSFNYLSEDRKWTTKFWGSFLEYSSDGRSYWHSSEGLAMAMADDNPEYAYRWDRSYTNFFKDDKNVTNNDLFGSLSDEQYVSIVNNNFIAAKGRLARFDGKYWYTADITSTSNSLFNFYFSYGEDIAVRPIQYLNSTQGYKGGRKVFDPNTLQWLGDVDITSSQYQKDMGYVGQNYHYYGNAFYYRQPDGTWLASPFSAWYGVYGGLGYEIFSDIHPNVNSYLTYFRNGTLSQNYISGLGSFSRAILLKARSEGNAGVVLYENPSGSYSSDARTYAVKLKLLRKTLDNFQGKQTDLVVSSVTVGTYNNAYYTSFDYDLAKATIDPSGTVALYNEVTVVPGSASPLVRPNGYTKTFFHNGLTAAELLYSVSTTDNRWSGLPYESQTFDTNGTLLSYVKTAYTSYNKDLTNNDGTIIESGTYVRPTSVIQMSDGIIATITNTYDTNTGMITQSSVSGPISSSTTYKYFWEAYDVTRSKNILSPVILTKQFLNSQCIAAGVVRYKSWTSTNNPSGVFASCDQFTWRGTASPDFSVWDVNSSPSSDWALNGKVTIREAVGGNAIEEQGPGGTPTSSLLNASLNQVIANSGNALVKDIAMNSFEDGSGGGFELPVGGVITTVPSGRSKTGYKYLDINTTGITKNGLTSSESYRISFWIKTVNGSLIVDGVGTVSYGNLSSWTYYEYIITGRTTINIRRSGSTAVLVDEVRIHPVKASMNSFTHHIVNGVQSTCDQNNQVVYQEYDEWGRPKNTLDEEGNILATKFYNYKN